MLTSVSFNNYVLVPYQEDRQWYCNVYDRRGQLVLRCCGEQGCIGIADILMKSKSILTRMSEKNRTERIPYVPHAKMV